MQECVRRSTDSLSAPFPGVTAASASAAAPPPSPLPPSAPLSTGDGAQLAKIPPFTRTTVGGILAVTLPVLLQLVSPYRIAFLPHRVANQFELWRLVTAFLYGGGGLNLVFSLIMMYRSLLDLEDGHFARRLADMSAWRGRPHRGPRLLTDHELASSDTCQPGRSFSSVSASS